MEIRNDILQELADVSPVMKTIREQINADIYEIPEDYFETLEINILEKTILNDRSFKEKDIPDGYFDTLESNIFAKIEESEADNKAVKMKHNDDKVYKFFSAFSKVAAVLLISFIAIKGFNFNQSKENKTTTAHIIEDQISKDDVMSYIEENLHDFEDDDLLALNNIETNSNPKVESLTTKTEEKKSTDINDYANPGEEITNEDILQYLHENIEDLSIDEINAEIF